MICLHKSRSNCWHSSRYYGSVIYYVRVSTTTPQPSDDKIKSEIHTTPSKYYKNEVNQLPDVSGDQEVAWMYLGLGSAATSSNYCTIDVTPHFSRCPHFTNLPEFEQLLVDMPLIIQTRADSAAKHELDITSLVFHNNRLYSGADDGKIKVWDEDLKLIGEVHAHPCSIFSLAIGDDTVYSCSNDGSVKAWSVDDLKERGTVLQEENEMWKVSFNEGKLYVGDDAGIVKIFQNNKIIGILEIMHPITELLALNNVVYTARDLYVIISQVIPSEKKIVTLKAIEGRAPVCVIGNKLCFPSRSGRDIYIHDNSIESDFNEVGQIKEAHEMIINALCGITHNGQSYLCTGGWDKVLKRWKLEEGSVQVIDSCSVEMCITALTIGSNGQIYIGGGDGSIFRVNVQS